MTESRLHKVILTATLFILFFAAFTTVANADTLYDSSGETDTTNQSVVDATSPLDAYSEKRQLEAIRAAIKEKGANWTAGKTSVSGLSLEEKRRLCGLKLPPEGLQLTPAEEEEKMKLLGQYPTAFDWRNNGGDWTTSIKNQREPKSCGSCWAFGSLAAFETQIDIAANDSAVNANLSEQYMLSCSAGSCGGYTLNGTMDFLRDTGTCDEACFPYQADDTIPCSDTCPYCDGRMWKLASWDYISPNATAVKERIQQAPVVAGMRVYGDFFFYTGEEVYEHTYGSYIGNHLIAIVGWNDTEECWICKNSWGTDWGEDTYGITGERGWFRIKYGECDLATNLSDFQAYATFDLPKRVTSCDSRGTEKDSFVPGDEVYIKALGLSPSTDYKVWIQPDSVSENDALVPENDPSSSQESVTTDANGNILSPMIWSIPSDATATCTEYDIVLDNQNAGTVGTYDAADDAIDSASVAGILAPISPPVHNLNTSESFPTIQAAIYDADTGEGDIIEVDPGTYEENVKVNKSLTIRSTAGNPADTIVQAEDSNAHVFEVTANYVNIRGFTVKNATANGKAGIYLKNVNHSNISDTNTVNNSFGVILNVSSSNTFENNNASNNTDYDFYSDENSYRNTVKNLTMGINYPTTISFTYDQGIGIKSVETPPSAAPSGKMNIRKYVNATNVTKSSWIFLNVSYTDADLGDVTESTLKMYKYNTSTSWYEVPLPNPNGVNAVENYVYANISSFFSIFAPFGEGTTPPIVTDPNATPATILNDNGRPRVPGTNISQLNVTVTDDTGVDTVTINLSTIGGSPEAQMTNILGTEIWTFITNATAGENETHNLVVNATDMAGNSNTSVSIPLTVLRRGDIVRDNVVNDGDMLYIAKYIVGKESPPDEFIAGVWPADSYDGVNDADMLYIAKYIVGKEVAP